MDEINPVNPNPTAEIRQHHVTAAERLRRLGELATEAKSNIYERAKLANELIDDRQFLQAKFNGDENACGEFLQREFFRDVGSLIDIFVITSIYRTFPDESQWAEQEYDLGALSILFNQELRRQRQAERDAREGKEAAAPKERKPRLHDNNADCGPDAAPVSERVPDGLPPSEEAKRILLTTRNRFGHIATFAEVWRAIDHAIVPERDD